MLFEKIYKMDIFMAVINVSEKYLGYYFQGCLIFTNIFIFKHFFISSKSVF